MSVLVFRCRRLRPIQTLEIVHLKLYKAYTVVQIDRRRDLNIITESTVNLKIKRGGYICNGQLKTGIGKKRIANE